MRFWARGGRISWWNCVACGVGHPGGLALGFGMWYSVGMAERALTKGVRKTSAITNAQNRLELAEVKKLIHESKICYMAIEIAQTGRRPHYDEETEQVVMVSLSEAAHIEMIKFVVKKVLPDAQEHESVDDKESHAHWAEIIEAENTRETVGV